MKRILAVLLIALLLAGMTACGADKPAGTGSDALLGHWYEKDGSAELDFAADGTFAASGEQPVDGVSGAVRYSAGAEEIAFYDADGNGATAAYTIKDEELTLHAGALSGVFVRTPPIRTDPAAQTDAPTEAPTEASTEVPTTQSLADTIIGTWSTPYKGQTLIYCFQEGGTGYASIMGIQVPIEYSTDNGVLSVTGYAFGTSDSGSAAFELIDGQLVATKDGVTLSFTRIE